MEGENCLGWCPPMGWAYAPWAGNWKWGVPTWVVGFAKGLRCQDLCRTKWLAVAEGYPHDYLNMYIYTHI